MLTPFKVNTVNLDNKGRYLEGVIPSGKLDLSSIPGYGDIVSMSDVRYSLQVSMVSGALLVSGKLAFSAECVCGRCLEKFELDFEDVEVCHYYEDLCGADEVDVAPDIREDALINLPSMPLCADDCRGLCSHCGCNLNVEDCGCETESESAKAKADDPGPWGALDALDLD